jgi:hypothetical protein
MLGGWLELGIQATDRYSLHAGYARNDPDDQDLSPGDRTGIRAWYLVQRVRFGKPFLVGVGDLCWTTTWPGLPGGTDNRVNAYAVFSF